MEQREHNLRALADFRSENARKVPKEQNRTNRQQLITRRPEVQVLHPQPERNPVIARLCGLGHWAFFLHGAGKSGTLAGLCPDLLCFAHKRTAQASTPRPLHVVGLLVLSGAGQNNHDWQRQNKEDNHKARLLAFTVSLCLFPVKQIIQGVACLLVALGKHMAVYVQRGRNFCVAQPL